MENNELIVREDKEDILKIFLSEEDTPQAFKSRVEELIKQGLPEHKAYRNVATTPIVMELFEDKNRGLFAVESEPLEYIEIFNPYTGLEIPNENLLNYSQHKKNRALDTPTRIVAIPTELLEKILEYLWPAEERSWKEMCREESGVDDPQYTPDTVQGHIFHQMKQLSEIMRLDTQFKSQSNYLTRRMIEEPPLSFHSQGIGDNQMQEIAELAEQFTKTTLHMPPGAILETEDAYTYDIWCDELVAILQSKNIPKK